MKRVVPVGALVLFAGCRTYGGDYNNTDLTRAQVGAVNAAFAEEEAPQLLAQVQAARAAGDTVRFKNLSILAEEYKATIARHQHWEEGLQQQADGYRAQNRALGAILMEQQALRDKLARLQATEQPVGPPGAIAGVRDRSHYFATPPFWIRETRGGAVRPQASTGSADTTAQRALPTDTSTTAAR